MDERLQRLELSKFIEDNAYGYTCSLLNESAQSNLSDAVLGKMFELTVGKYNKIDFSEIERSRGDVTKIKYYKNLNECINTLIDIHAVTNKIPSILIVSDALNNLITLKNTFEYNFRIKNKVAIMIYNTIMYAIMMSTSYIIAASIDISKQETISGANTVKVYEMDQKSLCLIRSLSLFNSAVGDGTLNKFMKEASKEDVQTEAIGDMAMTYALKKVDKILPNFSATGKKAAAVTGIAALGIFALYLGSHIIPIIREIVYWVYRSRQKISDAAALQAKFMELNIESLQQMDPNAVVGRTKILRKNITTENMITKQTKWVDRFKSISQKFALDADKSSRDAKIDIKQDKVDVSDVII